MRRFLLIAGVAILAALPAARAQKDIPEKEVAPDVPDAIQVPKGEEPVLVAYASASQIYTCQSTDGKLAWTLKAPEAELRDRKDKVIGQHFAGPTWRLQGKDSSEVTGKAIAHVDSLDADSIPWLLVNVISHAGKGQLTNVTTIQRVHTHGGKPPATGCDEQHKDAEAKSPYTADYYFFAPAK